VAGETTAAARGSSNKATVVVAPRRALRNLFAAADIAYIISYILFINSVTVCEQQSHCPSQ